MGLTDKGVLRAMARSRFFRKTFLSYIAISAVLFLIFQMINLYQIDRNYRETMDEMVLESMRQADSVSSSILIDLHNQVSLKIANNADLITLLFRDSFPTRTAMEARKLYSELKGMDSMIHSLSFINYNSGTVLTETNRLTLADFPDSDLLDYIATLRPSSSPYLLIPRMLQEGKGELRVLTMLYYPNTLGALAINLDYDKYTRVLNLYAATDNIEMMALNRYGQIIASTNAALYGTDMSADPTYIQFTEHSSPAGGFSSITEGEYTYHYYTGRSFGMNYFSRVRRMVFYKDNTLLYQNLVYSGVYLIVCLLLSTLLSFSAYLPLFRLNSRLHQAVGGERIMDSTDRFRQDEMDKLSQLSLSLAENNRTLSTNSGDVLLYRLLDPAFQTFGLDMAWEEQLGRLFPNPYYLVMLASVDRKWPENWKPDDLPLFYYSVQNMVTELLEEHCVVRGIALPGARQLAFFLNGSERDFSAITDALRSVQDVMATHFEVTVSFALGSLAEDVYDIRKSYLNAEQALSMRFLLGGNSIFRPEQLRQPTNAEHDLTFLIRQIEANLRAGNSEGLENALNAFFDEIAELSLYTAQSSVLQLLILLDSQNVVLEVESRNGLTTDTLLEYTLDDLRSMFLHSCGEAMEQMGEQRIQPSEKDGLVETVKALVEEKLCDQDLTVPFLADQVRLSVNYLRTIFRNAQGETLSSYITRVRLESICRDLTDTDIPIQQISEKMGFSNKTYFYAFFKKHTGMTPLQYRKSHQSREFGG